MLPAGWQLYRVYGLLPADAPVRFHLFEMLLGRQLWLLYIGITGRDSPARWAEHRDGSIRYDEPPKPWAPRAVRWERELRIYGTEAQARAAEKAAIQAENPFENTEHALPHSDKRPRARIRYRPTRARLWLSRVVLSLVIWAALTWLPWRVVTAQWLAWGTPTYTSMVSTAVFMILAQVLLVRSWRI